MRGVDASRDRHTGGTPEEAPDTPRGRVTPIVTGTVSGRTTVPTHRGDETFGRRVKTNTATRTTGATGVTPVRVTGRVPDPTTGPVGTTATAPPVPLGGARTVRTVRRSGSGPPSRGPTHDRPPDPWVVRGTTVVPTRPPGDTRGERRGVGVATPGSPKTKDLPSKGRGERRRSGSPGRAPA